MAAFSQPTGSDSPGTSASALDTSASSHTEYWLPQGSLGRGRWRRWFRVSTSGGTQVLGEELDQATQEMLTQPESLERVLAIVHERTSGRKAHTFTVNKDKDLSNFVPVSSLEIGVARSQAICRIARYFSLDTFDKLIDSIQASSNAADYDRQDILKEIFVIPEQVAAEVFKPKVSPLEALKGLNESQLAKLNPIPIGTGFLVGGTHLMTNNHVIADAIEAAECVAQFNYVKDSVGGMQQTIDYEFDPTSLFITNPALDYTLVQLKAGMFTRQAGYVFGWLQLSADDTQIAPGLGVEEAAQLKNLIIGQGDNGQGDNSIEGLSEEDNASSIKKEVATIPGDRVYLVQHPKGQEKQIVQSDNKVLDYQNGGFLKYFLRYSAASDYGSSGSPVFNTSWDLVALHHAAIAKAESEETSAPDSSAKLKPEIEAYQEAYQGQGVRICRIVEDLQIKSWSMPKLKNFIEDFVVTTEQITYPPLSSALNFTGGDKYVSLDNTIGFLTGSTDGTIKFWNQSGIELKPLHLTGPRAGSEAIEQISFSADGSVVAVVRSPQPGQRSGIEVWTLQGNSPQEINLTLSITFISSHPHRNDEPKIGSLIVCDDFYQQGRAIIVLSTDGYIDIWKLDERTLNGTPSQTLDVTQQDANLLPSIQEIEQQIAQLDQAIESDQQDLSRWGPGFGFEEKITKNERLRDSWQLEVKLLQDLANGAAQYTISVPRIKYYAQHSILVYSARSSIFILQQLDADPKQVKVSDFQDFALRPDGQELAVIGTDDITFWNLDGTPKTSDAGEKWLPAPDSGRAIFYGLNGHSFMAVGESNIYFWGGDIPDSSVRVSYLGPYLLDLNAKNALGQIHLRYGALSADGRVLLMLLNDGRLNLCKYDDVWESKFLKTLFHEGAIAFLQNPTALAPDHPNPFSLVDQEAYTLEVWAQPHSNGGGPILAKGSRIGTEYSIAISNGRILVNTDDQLKDGGAFENNTFLHIAVVHTKASTEIYLNGNPVKSEIGYGQFTNQAPPIPSEIAKTPLLIGGSIAAGSYISERNWTSDQAILADVPTFAGVISEVRIWKTARTQEQIKDYQNKRLPRSAQAEGLIGYWRAEEAQSPRIKNLVGNGDYGIIVGAEVSAQTAVAPRFTSALEFRQSADQVNCGNDISLATPTAITVEAWIKHNFGDGWIIHRITPDQPGYGLAWLNNKIRVMLQGQRGTKTVVDTRYNAPSDSAYHHIAFTWDQASQEVQIYIDGRRQDTVSVEGDYVAVLIDGQYRSTALFNDSLDSVSTSLHIGKSISDREYRNWLITEVRLWNVARTQNQIQSMMAQHLAELEPGLVGYWRLDDGGETNKNAQNTVAYWDGHTNTTDPRYHGKIEGAQWFPDVPSNDSGRNDTPRNDATDNDTTERTDEISDEINNSRSSLVGDGTPGSDDVPSNDSGRDDTPRNDATDNDTTEQTDSDNTSNTAIINNGGVNLTPSPLPEDIQTHWAKEFIAPLLNQNLMSSRSELLFKPDDPVIVADYAATIAAAFDLPLKIDAIAFKDVPPSHAAFVDAQKAYRMGFLLRSQDNAITPDRRLTCMEVMACLVRGMELKGGTLNLLSKYSDRNDIPANIQRMIATALRRGLGVNLPHPNRLNVTRDITRAELATLIYQARVLQGQAEAIASPYLVTLPDIPLFTDVSQAPSQKHWAADFIEGLADLGLINGFSDGSFKPDADMARADYAALLVAAFNPPPRSDRRTVNIAQPQLFNDVPANHAYFNSIQQIYRSGAMSGLSDNTFGVAARIRRDHAIAVLVAILDLPEGHLDTLSVYADREAIPEWVKKHVAAATEANLVIGYDSGLPNRQFRATKFATRAEVTAMIYQGLVRRGLAQAILPTMRVRHTDAQPNF